ncbi:MAG: DUF4340 domain-containing protein, partial [Planctomycetes bacterium]|nr:DUF4340 domain-containing protein [Planctomycetota bacterium]
SDRPSAPPPSDRPQGTVEDERSPLTTSLILFVAVVGLGLWAYFGEGSAAPPPKAEDHGIFPRETSYAFHPIQVVGIHLQRGQESVRFSRVPTEAEKLGKKTTTEEGHTAPINWQLTEPVADRGDDTQIFRLLNRIQHSSWVFRLEDASSFGETTVVVQLERKEDWPSMTLTFGTPIGGQVGMTVEMLDRPTRHFRIKDPLHTELTRPNWVWRRKVLFEVPLAEVGAVRATLRTEAGEQTIGVSRGVRTWRVDSPTGDLADRGKAEELVEAIRLLRGATIHDDQVEPQELEALGLKAPYATLTIDRLGHEPARLFLGNSHPERKEERYALLESRPKVVFTVRTVTFDVALRRKRELYLSRRLFMVEGGADAVSAIGAEVSAEGPRALLRWRVERKEEGWRLLDEGASPLAAKSEVDELSRALLGLRIGERIESPDLAALGLDAPTHRIELFEDEYRHVVEIGNKLEDGSYAVRRLISHPTQGQPPLSFVYLVRLGELLERLETADLRLLSPQIYAASSWDAQLVELKEADGTLSERVKFTPSDPAQPQGPKEWISETNPASFDDVSFKSWLKLFDRFNVQRYVARQKGAALKSYGLDAPRTLTIWVNGFENGKRVMTPQVLQIGRSEGESVYVMAPGGAAIGLVDERFLKKIYRGFDKGEVLWEVDPFYTSSVRIFRDGLLALQMVKPGNNWLWGAREVRRPLPVSARRALERLLLDDVVGRVVLHKTEAITPERLAKTGLDRPRWRVEIKTRPPGGDPKVHVLVIGLGAGGEDSVWARAESGETLGVYAGLRAIRSFLKRAQPPPPFPPKRAR